MNLHKLDSENEEQFVWRIGQAKDSGELNISWDELANILNKELGYEEGLTTTPFVLVVENNKYVDSIIGLADKELYITKFIEYGFIKENNVYICSKNFMNNTFRADITIKMAHASG